MAKVAVVFHSGYGHTLRVAQVIAQAADAELVAIDAEGNLPEGGWEALQAARAIVFGSPTYMGGPSWQFKKFADASSKPWFVKAWRDKLAAGFTCGGEPSGDKLGVLLQLAIFAAQHGMKPDADLFLDEDVADQIRARRDPVGSLFGQLGPDIANRIDTHSPPL